MNGDNKMDENVEKVLSLTTELLNFFYWNDENTIRKMRNYLYATKRKKSMLVFGDICLQNKK